MAAVFLVMEGIFLRITLENLVSEKNDYFRKSLFESSANSNKFISAILKGFRGLTKITLTRFFFNYYYEKLF